LIDDLIRTAGCGAVVYPNLGEYLSGVPWGPASPRFLNLFSPRETPEMLSDEDSPSDFGVHAAKALILLGLFSTWPASIQFEFFS
jgi:hypothetical protein